ncbi:sugar phosphate nucleotidyltransferase [Caloramator sp. mosi_1]|uniref:sugar phosphate nucleotidyltransferase n=1 Tax=Caloramator sp. mosi_1 TaxID=3023090 RepID=UPI002362D2F6|nr:sugar phosphate nucleotidyltransferase [Caloramator sp. mosi_1]WDC85031.1 sugar phosphate nucleotidyltransferase [Caloramator sp. mosi_1]
MGVTPTRPEIGYGYIEVGDKLQENVFRVKRFIEKPNLDVATSFLEKGNFCGTAVCLYGVQTHSVPNCDKLKNVLRTKVYFLFYMIILINRHFVRKFLKNIAIIYKILYN